MTLRLPRDRRRTALGRWRAAAPVLAPVLAALLFVLAVPGALPTGGPAGPVARAEQLTVTFEDFTVGSPNGQQGWTKTGAYDHLVTDAATTPSLAGYPSLGAKALRISNAVASGSFGDQTFSASLANEAGETAAQNGGLSGGVRSAYFEAEWDVASADPNAEQTGMAMSMSPDRGDGARMSYMGISDQPGGLTFTFYDFQGGDFVPAVVASNQPRNVVYNVKLQMIFVDGQVPNDIVRVYLNGSLVHTGTSWERYFLDVVAENPPAGNPPRTVDSLIFLTRGTSVPANAGKGFFIDNVKLTSGLTNVFVRTDGNDATCDGTVDAAATGSGVCAVQTIARGVQLAAALGATVNVGPGTYAANTVIDKPLTLKGNNDGVDPRNGGTRAAESILDGVTSAATSTIQIAANDVVIDGFTVQGGADAPVGGGVSFASGVTGWQLLNNIITDNIIGVYPRCSTTCTIQQNLFDGNNRPGAAGGAAIYTDFATSGLTINQNEFKNHSLNSSIIFAATSSPSHQNPVVTANYIHDNPAPDSAVYVLATSGATITNNRINQASGTAISLASGNSTVQVQNNDFSGSLRGIRIENDGYGFPDNTTIAINQNSFGGNSGFGLSVVNGYTGTLNAESNWWGSSSGPTNAGNPGGAGSTVSGASIDFTPFLTRGTDTSASIGFQPDTAAITTAFVRTDGSSTECDGSANAAFSTGALGACAVASVQKGVDNVQAGGTVNVAAGTYNGGTTVNKSVSIVGAGMNATILDGQSTAASGIATTTAVNGLTVKTLKLQNFLQDGVFMSGGVSIANVLFEDVESSNNGRHGFYITPNAGQSVTDFTLRRVTANGNNAAPAASQFGRGVWFINGTKTNITIEDGTFNNNRLVGIDLSEGTVANAVITGNTVTGNGDSGIGVLGPKTSMTVANNTVSNNGRFGIEIKNPDGPTSGASTLVVEGNTVTRTSAATDGRDHAGILTMRRGPQVPTNVDQPAGVIIQNNNVSGFRANAPSTTGDGFCIVVEGTNMTVRNNNVSDCDVGIQMQKGNTANTQGTQFFDRGDAADYSGITELNNVATTNTTGIRGVGLTAAANATRNWWGINTGPANANNPSGTGSTLAGTNVTFSPWLGDGTDTQAAVGFQPNQTPLVALNTQGINVSPTTGLTTTENGGTAQFAIVLASQPTGNVTIGLTSSNTNEGTVNPASVTFTPANWNVPRAVTVTGVSAGAANGNVAYTIVTAPATSSDPLFNGVDPSDVSVTNNAASGPTISVADATVVEGNGEPVQMTFNVTLSQAHVRTVTVNYATAAGTATSGSDYVPTSGTLTFAPGETAKTISVLIQGDSNAESDETFLVNLSNPVEASFARSQATGTIDDDEPAAAAPAACSPRPNISVTTQAVGGRQMQVTVKADTAAPNTANTLTTIQFSTPTNASVQMAGQSSIGTNPITLAAGTRQIVFLVQQTNANAAFQASFKVTDSCGSVDKFVGGGKDAVAN